MSGQIQSSLASVSGFRTLAAAPTATAGAVSSNLPPEVTVPAGMAKCPASGPGAACPASDLRIAEVPGHASLPDGMSQCPTPAYKPLPATLAACTGTMLDTALGPAVSAPAGPPQAVSLGSDTTELTSGQKVVLTATATSSVSDIGGAIEIFDTTAGSLIGACGENSRCAVAYAADGGTHVFEAFFTAPTTDIPEYGAALASNGVAVNWLKAGITADKLLAAPGEKVVLTATAAMDVQSGARWLEIYDLTSHTRITYCARGTVCATSIEASDGKTHQIVAYVTGTPESMSPPIYVTWLSVKLTATSLRQSGAGQVYLQASVDTDLSNTSWQIGIYDSKGHLVGDTCNSGSTCSAVTSTNGRNDSYTAVVTGPASDVSTQAGRVEVRGVAAGAPTVVVARSESVTPTRLLWGVDSCKTFTTDPTGTNLYGQVASMLGTPDFWGRYLTDTGCAGISQAEIAAAAHSGMGILPIYDDYDCSAVNSYATGAAYAAAATAAAQNLGIPLGVGLAIDIEPPGPQCPGAGSVDAGFVNGWHDGISAAGYVPIYYGNGTAGSEFANAWCTAVAGSPTLASDSLLWSFEPSLLGNFRKGTAPDFSPYAPQCDATVAAWQYRISPGSTPDVDHDLAESSVPLWYPSSDQPRTPPVGAY